MMKKISFKGQSTFEFSALQVALLVIVVLIIAFLYYYYSTIANSIQSSNLYSFSSIYFYPAPGQANPSNIIGEMQISIFSPRVPDFSKINSYLIQITNSSFPSNCGETGLSAFNSSGYYCITLPPESSQLPEGNDKYLVDFSNVGYNYSAYSTMNTTEPSSIKYFVTIINGKPVVQKLSPELSIQIN